ncbi:hypothetical protein PGT21_036600 [Puccinia graminis f. sp. tritici]|uniref:Uncharacterized protein n=1 Tax=Puccinia graminis f. sp. tritici TaxID=56615 RepID=A0A5B0QQG3_PUCGR|nr:hypothetical protein PGT21_036600 [Puccinia graminis f. sp. tritici]
MYQPCHRCNRSRSAISVPAPRRSSFLSVGIFPFPLVRSATISLLLEFDWPPLISSSTASLDRWWIHLDRCMTPPPILLRASAAKKLLTCSQPVEQLQTALRPRRIWDLASLGIVPAEIPAPAVLSSIKAGLSSPLSFPPHQLTSSSFNAINNRFPTFNLTSHYHTTCSSLTTPYPTTITNPSSSLTASIMSSIFDNCDTNDFYCEGRSDPSIDWSPVFNPNVVPDDNAVGNKAPIDAVGDKTPIDVKPPMDAKDKGPPAEATVDPASINTIGMEIVETRTHYFPLKDKWHAINDPSRHYDCPHPFVCVPWNVHDPELPPGLPVPFLRTLNLPVPAPTPASSQPSSSESSSNDSDSSSTYPLISNYINLNHQGVQKLLLDDNTPQTAVCIYTEEDVMRIFEGIAPEYVDMCSEYPPSSLAESDRRVMFFENMQWFFRNKRSTYLSTRKF